MRKELENSIMKILQNHSFNKDDLVVIESNDFKAITKLILEALKLN